MRGYACWLAVCVACGGGGGGHGSGSDSGAGGDGTTGPTTWSIDLPMDTEWMLAAADAPSGHVVAVGRLVPAASQYPALRIMARNSSDGSLAFDAILQNDNLYPSAIALTPQAIYFGGIDYSWTVFQYSAVDGHKVWAQVRTTTNDMCGSHPTGLWVDGTTLYTIGFDNTTSCGSGNYDREWVVEARDAAAGTFAWMQTYNPYCNACISDEDTGAQVVATANALYTLGTSETQGWIVQSRAKADGTVMWEKTVGGDAWSSGTGAAFAVDDTGMYLSITGAYGAPFGNGWTFFKTNLADGSPGWTVPDATFPQQWPLLFGGRLLSFGSGLPVSELAKDTGSLATTTMLTLGANATLISDGSALFSFDNPPWTMTSTTRLARVTL